MRPMRDLPLAVKVLEEGDAYARERVRVAEIEASFVAVPTHRCSCSNPVPCAPNVGPPR